MYDRTVNNRELTFEPSGGLINASLVMQDKETDSYWPIMRGSAVEGELKGTSLTEVAVNKKMKWKDWKRKHPGTLVLSVAGREDSEQVYEGYFQSQDGFRDVNASDTRLQTKAPIFAFRWQGKNYAAAFGTFKNGHTWRLDDTHVFLFRAPSDELFKSTAAFLTTNEFAVEGGRWRTGGTDCEFSPESQTFVGQGQCPQPLTGFDTFWYNWSLNNPDTLILK
ncbi:MAG: DUF3179 domain-containing protein [Halieaceae bacterium]|nr:DUF3179 domain-containing protein [Halieaceae bacterium]